MDERLHMRMMPAVLLSSALLASANAGAAGLLEFYVGAGVGQSTLRQDYYQIDSHVTGWKAVAGWHPLDLLRAEVEYANYVNKDVTYVKGTRTTQISKDTNATAAFAKI